MKVGFAPVIHKTIFAIKVKAPADILEILRQHKIIEEGKSIVICGDCLEKEYGGIKPIPFEHGIGIKEFRTKRHGYLAESIFFSPSKIGKRRCKICREKLGRNAWEVILDDGIFIKNKIAQRRLIDELAKEYDWHITTTIEDGYISYIISDRHEWLERKLEEGIAELSEYADMIEVELKEIDTLLERLEAMEVLL